MIPRYPQIRNALKRRKRRDQLPRRSYPCATGAMRPEFIANSSASVRMPIHRGGPPIIRSFQIVPSESSPRPGTRPQCYRSSFNLTLRLASMVAASSTAERAFSSLSLRVS
jgi:hypothetical protein